MIRVAIYWTLGGLLSGASAAAPAPSASVVTQQERSAVLDELSRSVEGLHIEGAAAPYALRATLQRASLLHVVGRYGALSESQMVERAMGEVEVRVGSPARDSTQLFGSGAREVFQLPLRPEADATRRALWLATDAAYKGAIESLDIRAAVEASLNAPRETPDWSPPAVVREDSSRASSCAVGDAPLERARRLLTSDRSSFERLVRTLSERFTRAPWVESGAVTLQAVVAERSDLDTDGLEHCEARIGLVVAVVARGRARDGLVLPRAGVLHLEGEEWLGEDRWDLIAREGDALVKGTLSALESLADAPRVEDDYDGPMILSPRAAAQLLAVTVLSHASGTPAPLSEYGPMTELQPHWIDSLGDQVMPPWLNVTDDPRLEGGFGSYVEDVQGVLARPVELVRDGELKTLWMSRHPNTSIVESNGRARGTLSLTEGTSPSNLTVQSARAGLSPSAMEADALARAREDGYDHIYVVESLRDESVLGVNEIDEAAGYGTGRRVDLPAPASLVRVDADGTRIAVRGGLLTSASLRVLRRIRAVGAASETTRFRVPPGVSGGLGAALGLSGILTDTVNVQVTTPSWLVEGLTLVPVRGDAPRAPRLRHPLQMGAEAP